MIYFPKLALEKYSTHLSKISCSLRLDGLLPPELLGLGFVFLCYTNRCGSNFVAEAMASGGSMNLAAEFLNYDQVLAGSADSGLTCIQEYVRGVALNDMVAATFVCKVSVEHLVVLESSGMLDYVLPRARFVLIQRSDKIGQAISHSIADQTQQWASYNSSVTNDPVFDGPRIREYIKQIDEQYLIFDEFFSSREINPLLVNYEIFSENPEKGVSEIAAYLGRNISFEASRVRTGIQRSERNEIWRTAYLGEWS